MRHGSYTVLENFMVKLSASEAGGLNPCVGMTRFSSYEASCRAKH